MYAKSLHLKRQFASTVVHNIASDWHVCEVTPRWAQARSKIRRLHACATALQEQVGQHQVNASRLALSLAALTSSALPPASAFEVGLHTLTSQLETSTPRP